MYEKQEPLSLCQNQASHDTSTENTTVTQQS